MSLDKQLIDIVFEALERSADLFIQSSGGELDGQGHVLTGRLKRMDRTRKTSGTTLQVHVLMEDYFDDVDQGRPPGEYTDVRDLQRYFSRRGVNGPDNLRAAIRTSRRHYIEGMPTRASYRFSSNGRRTDFIEYALKAAEQPILQEMGKIPLSFEHALNQALKSFDNIKIAI